METIAVSEFRANMIQILKRIQSGASITITSRGQEIARLLPPEKSMENARAALKELRKTAKIGDVLSPIDVEWKAMK